MKALYCTAAVIAALAAIPVARAVDLTATTGGTGLSGQSQTVGMPVSTVCGLALVTPAGSASQSLTLQQSTFTPVQSISIQSTTPFTINLNVGAGLAGNAPALAAWERAAAQWTSRFYDPVTVNINADLQNMNSASIIGSTSAVLLYSNYAEIRDSVVADAAVDGARDAIVNSLPTVNQYNARLPNGFTLSGNLNVTKANAKALGYTGLDSAFGNTDATITFNSGFAFDYDNRNGVTGIDFESVAAHEMGHALGFMSSVDDVDYYKSLGQTAAVTPTVLDLFRFGLTTANPTTTDQFTANTRSLLPGEEDVTSDLTNAYQMSTGFYTGDGYQASHWKDVSLTGNLIGIMNPTIGYDTVRTVSSADVRALDLIGWDAVAPAPEPTSLALLVLGGIALLARRK